MRCRLAAVALCLGAICACDRYGSDRPRVEYYIGTVTTTASVGSLDLRINSGNVQEDLYFIYEAGTAMTDGGTSMVARGTVVRDGGDEIRLCEDTSYGSGLLSGTMTISGTSATVELWGDDSCGTHAPMAGVLTLVIAP